MQQMNRNTTSQCPPQSGPTDQLIHLTLNTGKMTPFHHDSRFSNSAADWLPVIRHGIGVVPGAPDFNVALRRGAGWAQFLLGKGNLGLVTGGIVHETEPCERHRVWRSLLASWEKQIPWIQGGNPAGRMDMPSAAFWVTVVRDLQVASLTELEAQMLVAIERDLAWSFQHWALRR